MVEIDHLVAVAHIHHCAAGDLGHNEYHNMIFIWYFGFVVFNQHLHQIKTNFGRETVT